MSTREEEDEEYDRWFEAHMKKMGAAMEALRPIREAHKGENWAGVVGCPVCSAGKLHVHHHGYNNHVWARCETEGCVSWVE